MNFKLVPAICPYSEYAGGSNLAPKDSKVFDVKPWTKHRAYADHLYHDGISIQDFKQIRSHLSSDKTLSIIDNEPSLLSKTAPGCTT